jgi:CRISPR-associated endonuclease Csy4
MKHYIDITLLPSDDIGMHFLWSKVMMQVHLALVEIQDIDNKTSVAVSFPDYKEQSANLSAFMGKKMRLFAMQPSDLEDLNINKWLNRLDDYVHIKAINDVPNHIKSYESFNRVTKAGSADKHIRRRMMRNNETLIQAELFYNGYVMDKGVKALPFIKMKSLGGGNEFKMSIRRKSAVLDNVKYSFSTYGFNRHAALPKF